MEPMRRLDFLRRMAVLGGAFLMPWTTVPDKASGSTFTETNWDTHIRDNLNFLKEVEYEQFTANVPVTATTAGTANLIIAASTITYEAVPHLVEFYCPYLIPANTGTSPSMFILLTDGGAGTGVARIGQEQVAGTSYTGRTVHTVYRFTPTAASHTYEIRAYVTGGTGTVSAGAGGADTMAPGFIRITRIPT